MPSLIDSEDYDVLTGYFIDHCYECSLQILYDSPQECYYNGGGSCGDCERGCFDGRICEICGGDYEIRPIQTME